MARREKTLLSSATTIELELAALDNWIGYCAYRAIELYKLDHWWIADVAQELRIKYCQLRAAKYSVTDSKIRLRLYALQAIRLLTGMQTRYEPCGDCEQCISGKPSHCTSKTYTYSHPFDLYADNDNNSEPSGGIGAQSDRDRVEPDPIQALDEFSQRLSQIRYAIPDQYKCRLDQLLLAAWNSDKDKLSARELSRQSGIPRKSVDRYLQICRKQATKQ